MNHSPDRSTRSADQHAQDSMPGQSSYQRTTLVEAHLPLVHLLANWLCRRLPPQAAPVEDLTQSGVVGLLEAVDRYNPQYRVPFSAFAFYRIQGAMLDYLRSETWVSR